MLEKVLFRIDDNVKFLIDKTARLEERVNHLSGEVRILRSEVRGLRGRLWWIIGILVSMWSSTIALLITILLKLIGFL